jgi:hypothetical protein
LYASLNIIRLIIPRRMRLVGHVACTEEMINIYRMLACKVGGKRPRCRLNDNIEIDLQERVYDVH